MEEALLSAIGWMGDIPTGKIRLDQIEASIDDRGAR